MFIDQNLINRSYAETICSSWDMAWLNIQECRNFGDHRGVEYVPTAPIDNDVNPEIEVEGKPPELSWEELLHFNNAIHKQIPNTSKFKVYFKGKKSKQVVNSKPNPDQEQKPLFVKEKNRPSYNKVKSYWFPCSRKRLLRKFETDQDLIYELKMESAFMPRDTTLLLSLKYKARRYLDMYDLTLFTMKERYEIIMRAVGAAMLIDEEEEKVRNLLDSYHEKHCLRPAHNAFLKEGRTSVHSATSLTSCPKKESALGGWVKKKLISDIRF